MKSLVSREFTCFHLRKHLPVPARPRPANQAKPFGSRRTSCRATRDSEGSGSGAEDAASPSGRDSSDSVIPDTLPLLGADTDWREFRARLVASSRKTDATSDWAHPVAAPEPGCCLVAHPLMFGQSQKYFYQAVILILGHDEKGSYGIILNRPTEYHIRDLDLGAEVAEFKDCKLYMGGDVGHGSVHLLHGFNNFQGAEEIVKGVYIGGMEPAREAIKSGTATHKDFKWYARYSGWGPGQLQSECKAGVWFTAAASPSVILSEPKQADGCDMWINVMKLLGGDHAKLAESVEEAVNRLKRTPQGPAKKDATDENKQL